MDISDRYELNTKTLTDGFSKVWIGLDRMVETVSLMAESALKNYPPFNIVKLQEDKYTIEIAVAGFARNELEVELDNDRLVIRGSSKTEEPESSFLYKGLANRAFTRQFKLADNIEIKNAKLINGVLKIFLEAITPEKNKVKKVEIEENENG